MEKLGPLIVKSGLMIYLLISNSLFAQEDQAYLKAPQLIRNAELTQNYSTESRQFTGIPSLAISPKGRMWAVWYAGLTAGEDLNNYVVVATSGDQGKSWEEVLVIDPDGPGPVRSFDPEVWMDPNGKLWIFWAQAAAQPGGTWSLVSDGTLAGVWGLKIDDPETKEIKVNEPVRLADGVMMCKP